MTETARLRLSNTLLSWGLMVFFSYDFMAKLLSLYEIAHAPYQWATGFKYAWLILVLLLRDRSNLEKRILWIPLAIGVCLLLGMSSLWGIMTPDDIFFNGYYYLAHAFPMFFLLFFAYFDQKEVLHKFLTFFKLFLILNSMLILISLFAKFPWALTYFKGSRFGYQGVLLYHAESAYLYFLGIALFLAEYWKHRKWKDLLFLLLNVTAALMIGTKKSYLLLCLLVIPILYYFRKNIFTYIALVLTSVGLFIFRGTIAQMLAQRFKVLYQVYEEDGLLSMLLSYRDVLLKEKTIPFIETKWSFFNVLVGGPKLHEFRSEMELIDLFLFVGILGTVCYFAWFYALTKYLTHTAYGKYLLACLLITAFFSGSLLASINTSLAFFFVQKGLNRYQ